MNYKLLIKESSPQIIGVKNGIYQVEIDKGKFTDSSQFDSIINFFDRISYQPSPQYISNSNVIIDGVTLVKGCILTDFLSFSPFLMGCPFMASERLVKKLNQFNIGVHYWFSTSLPSYKLLYLPFLDENVIDFKKTIFSNQPRLTKPKELLKFYNIGHYKEHALRMPFLTLENLYLNSTFDSNVHLFQHRLSPGIFISETLLNETLNCGFTGARILNPGPTAQSVESNK